MKNLIAIALLIVATSCIPYKIAPKFKDKGYKIVRGQKFKRTLPNETSYIFKDPKDANEFYNYLNTKYSLNHTNVGLNTPITIENNKYTLSYYEAERSDEIANIGLVATDLVLKEKTGITAFEDNYSSRKGHWYIVITLHDENLNNGLLENHPKYKELVQFLKKLQKEYLNTFNYEELLFIKKS
ncbi:hypothetical protein [uncultured Winogradskyella sp.]|uniref:hypothetical protein n=1 Tax=uncultured Winogradskyella sp. TaxID=395353 RepID=UPI0026374BC7|nr:hypothetical protein [uncultured Winogradskyella sp.]